MMHHEMLPFALNDARKLSSSNSTHRHIDCTLLCIKFRHYFYTTHIILMSIFPVKPGLADCLSASRLAEALGLFMF